ncbi:MAG: TlpA family protein disulfide reductase [Actinobacteria bacterium]|nr:TlpA family protein disulfide reductase [Actinomycetota bacterium]
MSDRAAPPTPPKSSTAPAGRAVRRRLSRGVAIVVVLLFVALLAYGLLSKATNRSIDESLAKGTAPSAPEFEDVVLDRGKLPNGLAGAVGPALADGKLGLRELRGIPVVLNFWASWCIPCREEAPILGAGWKRYGPQGVLFLGLNMQDLTGDARAFIGSYHLTYPTIREPSNDTARNYGVTGIPETYFISARGRVVAHVIGVIDEGELDEDVAAARSGKVVGTGEGGEIRPQR